MSLTGIELAEKLTANDGPLNSIASENIDRIETNLQIAHAPKSAVRDFRTDYLLKVFDYDAQSQAFEEAPLENQIDRERILADDKLKREFKAWLLDPEHFTELDRGTVLIPEKFLATGAIAATPAGFAASNLQPAFGLVQGDDATADPVFKRERRRRGAEEGRRARRAPCKTSARWRALSAGSTTSPARDATRPAASAAFIFRASTGWRRTPPIPPSCRRRRISSATRSGAAIS